MDFWLIYQYLIKTFCQKKWNIYISIKWQIPVPYGSMLHTPPTNYILLAAQQESYSLSPSLREKNIEEFGWEGGNQKNGPVDRKKTRKKEQ